MNERKLICKNDLVDATKKYRPLELKIFYNMLYVAKEQEAFNVDLQGQDTIYMPVSKLENFLGCKHLTQKELINIITNIPKGIRSRDGKCYIAVFSSIRYNEQEGDFEFKITQEFKPYIEDVIKNFTVLELNKLSNLNSIYSQRLFEFVSKNKNLRTVVMNLDSFKEYFKVPKSYSMCNIDQSIISVAVQEINNFTDFHVEIQKIKAQNKVTHVRINIKQEAGKIC